MNPFRPGQQLTLHGKSYVIEGVYPSDRDGHVVLEIVSGNPDVTISTWEVSISEERAPCGIMRVETKRDAYTGSGIMYEREMTDDEL